MVDYNLLGLTLEFVGTLLLAIMLLRVHMKVSKEHRIDKKVLRSMRREKSVGFVAIILIVAGFVLQITTF